MVLRNVRINLLMITSVLICIGIVMIYSASSIYSLEKYHDSMFFLKRHLSFILIGLVLTALVMSFDYRLLSRYSRPLLATALVFLVLVLIPGVGREVSGARRWFRFGVFSFQPAEFANVMMIVYLADFICRKQDQMRSFVRGIMPVMAMLGMISLLILMQPDLGTTLSVCVVVFLMLYISGARLTYLAGIVLAALPALYLLVFSVPYRRMRIMAFLNPWADPRGSGFQIIQSQVALGSGGLFGVGLGHSQQKLFYLPAAHTDFIVSIIGEELGMLGTVSVIVLFIAFLRLGLTIVKHATDKFGYFLGLGLLMLIAFKATVNIGVSCGLLPTKGLPLPFISYGGSSLIFDMVSVGLLLNIAKTGESSV